MTKLQALDKFCLYYDYDTNKLVNETKLEFLKRYQKDWAIRIVRQQVVKEEQATADTQIAAQTVGLDI